MSRSIKKHSVRSSRLGWSPSTPSHRSNKSPIHGLQRLHDSRPSRRRNVPVERLKIACRTADLSPFGVDFAHFVRAKDWQEGTVDRNITKEKYYSTLRYGCPDLPSASGATTTITVSSLSPANLRCPDSTHSA
jgi:hypothetical protein